MTSVTPPGLFFLAVLFPTLLSAQGKQQGSTPVEVYSVSVQRKPKTKDVTLFGNPGLELRVAGRLAGKRLLEIVKNETKLAKFVDDKGTDLGKGADRGFFFWVSLERGFKKEPSDIANLKIRTKTLPAKDAGQIELVANVAFLSAAGTGTSQHEIKLQKGAKFTVGEQTIRISRAKKPRFGGAKWQVDFSSDTSFAGIQKIEFLGESGKPLNAKGMGTSSSGSRNKTTYTKSFGLPEKVDKAKVKVTFYKNVETVHLPVKLTFGLGL